MKNNFTSSLDFSPETYYNLCMSNENSKPDSEKPKKRGRPPLPPEERERRRIERNKLSNEIHKKTGYAAQKKYKKNNYDVLSILLPKESRHLLDEIVYRENTTISSLFLNAVEEKYSVKLSKGSS